MKTIDARGLACPLPVIQTKKALNDDNQIETIVDNDIAVQNLEKMANQLGYHVSNETKDDGFYVYISKNKLEAEWTNLEQDKAVITNDASNDVYIVVINTDEMGKGDSLLGKNLMKTFVNTLLAQDTLPTCVLLYNTGVKLVTEVEQTIEDFKELEANGVEVLACGACLDYYGLTEQLKVGAITNMYHIVNTMRLNANVIKP